MTTKEELEWQLKINKKITEIEKNIFESSLIEKKLKWYEITLVVTIIGLSIAFTKLFL